MVVEGTCPVDNTGAVDAYVKLPEHTLVAGKRGS